MKFKAGDTVRIKSNDIGPLNTMYKKGDIATYLGGDRFKMYDENTQYISIKTTRTRVFEKISVGHPKKIKYIAQYDLTDRDPVKEFYSRPELMKWLKEAQDDSDIVWDSIKIYPVDKVMRPYKNVKISLRKV